MKDGVVTLHAVDFTLETAFGSVRRSRRPEDFEEASRIAKDSKAQRTVRKMRKS
jgi:hypothetical protein